MIVRTVFFTFLACSTGFAQVSLPGLTFGGSDNASMHGVTVDSSGNIYVTGTTYSSDLTVKNAFQPINSGTQVIYSADSGASWMPLQSPLAPTVNQNFQIAVDPVNASILYAALGTTLCKSLDGGREFKCAALGLLPTGLSITSILVDPRSPSTVYLTSNVSGSVFKSTDGGQSWNSSGQGLQSTGFPYSLAIDPHRAGVLYAWSGSGGYVSTDGAATWTPSTLPYPSGIRTAETIFGFFFDAVTPGVVYGPGFTDHIILQKSTDGGQTWAQLNTPFSIYSMAPDPQNAGILYALGIKTGNTGFPSFWKSTDGGASWISFLAPPGLFGPLTFDPRDPQIILAGYFAPGTTSQPATYRSSDGGKTWSLAIPRFATAVFAPSKSGVVYAIAPPTSDAFLAKFLPDGKTLVFATYFGGAGNDTGNAVALDRSGNIWMAGNTSSPDFPVTPGAFQSTRKGRSGGFLAKFTNDGQLVASTYLGGSAQDSIAGIAVDPQGHPWIIGNRTSPDFPFTNGAPPLSLSYGGFFSELDSSAGRLLVSKPLDGQADPNGNGIAVDSSGNAILTGTTTNPNFPSTVQPLSGGAPPMPKVFVVKVDPSGNTIYSTFFGGSQEAPIVGRGIGLGIGGSQTEEDRGVAAAVDSAGNAYITGYTSATDFPTTAGAYQRTLGDACPYPAFMNNTGFIGVISEFYMDDSFVVKLSPDGKTAMYSTLVGGQCFDHAVSIAVDASGRAIIAGETDSADYPLISAVEGAPPYGEFSSFVSVLNPSGSALDYSTYLRAGASPFAAAGSNGSLDVAGSAGLGAQSSPASGAYITNIVNTVGYLAVLNPPEGALPVNLTQALNAFSLKPGPVAPGEIVALGVPNLVADRWADIGINLVEPLSTTLAGVQVFFDGRAAFIISVTPGRIVCIAPVEIAGQSSTAIQVMTRGAPSNILNVEVAPSAIGLLSLDGTGTGRANARNADGTLNSDANPAAIGSLVTVYFTGAGVTNPPEADGVAPAGYASVPRGSFSLLPTGGAIFPLPGFVPGLFSYTFTVPAAATNPFYVSTQTNFVQSQFLQVSVK